MAAGLWVAEGSELPRLLASSGVFAVGAMICFALNKIGQYRYASILWIAVIILTICICDEPDKVVRTRRPLLL
jgi:hypothetical protein